MTTVDYQFDRNQFEKIIAGLLLALWGTHAGMTSSRDFVNAFLKYGITNNNDDIKTELNNYSQYLNSVVPEDTLGKTGKYIVIVRTSDGLTLSSDPKFELNQYLIDRSHDNYNIKSPHEPASSRNLIHLGRIVEVDGFSADRAFVNFSKHAPKAYVGGIVSIIALIPRIIV
jgi:hypothetical protein